MTDDLLWCMHNLAEHYCKGDDDVLSQQPTLRRARPWTDAPGMLNIHPCQSLDSRPEHTFQRISRKGDSPG